MRLMTFAEDASPNFSKLSLSLATTPKEVREVQRLRYKVFVEAMGLSALANADGLDQDEFDAYCDHLIVRDTRSLKVVGTYRILSPGAIEKTGGFYSEKEFDLSRLSNLRKRITEAGRACIHPDYRSGGVIMMLWAGIAACMRKEKTEYLIGCASVSLADGGNGPKLAGNRCAEGRILELAGRLRARQRKIVAGDALQLPHGICITPLGCRKQGVVLAA